MNLITNALDFIIDSLEDHSLEEIQNLDDETILEFGEDYLFNPQDLREALQVWEHLKRRNALAE